MYTTYTTSPGPEDVQPWPDSSDEYVVCQAVSAMPNAAVEKFPTIPAGPQDDLRTVLQPPKRSHEQNDSQREISTEEGPPPKRMKPGVQHQECRDTGLGVGNPDLLTDEQVEILRNEITKHQQVIADLQKKLRDRENVLLREKIYEEKAKEEQRQEEAKAREEHLQEEVKAQEELRQQEAKAQEEQGQQDAKSQEKLRQREAKAQEAQRQQDAKSQEKLRQREAKAQEAQRQQDAKTRIAALETSLLAFSPPDSAAEIVQQAQTEFTNSPPPFLRPDETPIRFTAINLVQKVPEEANNPPSLFIEMDEAPRESPAANMAQEVQAEVTNPPSPSVETDEPPTNRDAFQSPTASTDKTNPETIIRAEPASSYKLLRPLSEVSQVQLVDVESYVNRSERERGKESENAKQFQSPHSLYRKAYEDRAKNWVFLQNQDPANNRCLLKNQDQIVSRVLDDSWELESKEVRQEFDKLSEIDFNAAFGVWFRSNPKLKEWCPPNPKRKEWCPTCQITWGTKLYGRESVEISKSHRSHPSHDPDLGKCARTMLVFTHIAETSTECRLIVHFGAKSEYNISKAVQRPHDKVEMVVLELEAIFQTLEAVKANVVPAREKLIKDAIPRSHGVIPDNEAMQMWLLVIISCSDTTQSLLAKFKTWLYPRIYLGGFGGKAGSAERELVINIRTEITALKFMGLRTVFFLVGEENKKKYASMGDTFSISDLRLSDIIEKIIMR